MEAVHHVSIDTMTSFSIMKRLKILQEKGAKKSKVHCTLTHSRIGLDLIIRLFQFYKRLQNSKCYEFRGKRDKKIDDPIRIG